MSEKFFLQHDVENKDENENEIENEQFLKNKIIKEEIKSLNWFNKKKFKEILAIINSNKFG